MNRFTECMTDPSFWLWVGYGGGHLYRRESGATAPSRTLDPKSAPPVHAARFTGPGAPRHPRKGDWQIRYSFDFARRGYCARRAASKRSTCSAVYREAKSHVPGATRTYALLCSNTWRIFDRQWSPLAATLQWPSMAAYSTERVRGPLSVSKRRTMRSQVSVGLASLQRSASDVGFAVGSWLIDVGRGRPEPRNQGTNSNASRTRPSPPRL